MSTTYSYIHQTIDRIRAMTDLESFQGKYNNTWILRNLIQPAYRDLFGRINNNQIQNRIIESFDVSIVEDTERYLLPPGIRHVLGFYFVNSTTGEVEEDWYPATFHERNQSWRLEGVNGRPYLWIDIRNPWINKTRTMRVYYVGLQDFEWSYGTGGSLVGTTSLTIGTPSVGIAEKRPYGFVGGILRLFDSGTGEETIETPISAYEPSNGAITTRFTMKRANGTDVSTGQVSRAYEVVPSYSESIMDAVAAGAAILAANVAKLSQSHKRDLQQQYMSHRKTALDDAASMNLRLPEHVRRDTVDRAYELQDSMRYK